MRQLYIVDSDPDAFGPWQSRPVADLVVRILEMMGQYAEVCPVDLDPYASELISGLRPFKITIVRSGRKIISNEVSLCWPPEPESCKLREEESLVEYFVWAKGKNDAISIMASLASAPPKYKGVFDSGELPLASDALCEESDD